LEVIYAPKAGFVGEDRFVYIVSDGHGGFAMATISVTVNASNPTAPVANIVQVSTTPDAATAIDLSGYISDKETPTANLVISSVSTPTSPATLTQSGQNVTYTPNGFIGVDTLTYTVTDGTLSTTGYMVITVNPDDSHDLVANDLSRTTPAGSPITIDLSGEISSTDPTAGTLSIVSVVGATLGDVVVSGNTVTYTPKVGDYGQDAFVYNIKDSHDPAHYAQGLITVDITPPSGPEITTLTVSGTPTIGGTLSSNVACSTCNSSQYEYDWSINGITVATTPTYVYQSTDPDNNVRLKVTGVDIYGQETVEYSTYRVSVVKEIFANRQAFAALKNDGSVVTWGSGFGQDSSSVDLSSDVQTIYSNYVAFAAVKSDGSVVTWGQGVGGGDSSSVDFSSGVKEIYSSHYSFAALKNDGSMVAWKDAAQGGDSSSVDFTGGVISATAVSVGGYAALKSDGSVVSWGNNSDTSSVDFNGGVKQLFSNAYAFAAIKTDGSVVTWGDNSYGGNSSSVDFTGGVKNIYSNVRAFAAIKGDNSVVTWGDWFNGANSTGVDFSGGVKEIYSTQFAFAALKLDGSVVTWGRNGFGGDSSGVDFSDGVKDIFSTASAFAALKNNGSVVTWGYGPEGGDSSGVDLSSNVETIVSTERAFTAIKNDGTVVSWGNPAYGGDSSGVDFSGGVKAITSSQNNRAFSALKNDGSVVTWGETSDTPTTAQPLITLVETSIP
ncbi:TPA: Ig-like domain-containing protein, partial [Vibrio parahaemolyticus]